MKTASSVKITPHLEGRRLDLEWKNPPASDFSLPDPPMTAVRVVRGERTFPLSPADGAVVYSGPPVTAITDSGLTPLTTYYYTVFALDASSAFFAGDESRAYGFATGNHGLAGKLYKLLPAVHQALDAPLTGARLDVLPPAVRVALAALPVPLRNAGQLQRFLHTVAAPLDVMRSMAEGLRQLHAADIAPADFLPLLGHWIGWDLDRTIPVYARRNEVAFAPALFRTAGSIPNIRSLVNRYAGWHAQVAEFAQSILRTNTPPERSIFSIIRRGADWRASDDAAPILGYGPGNNEATGAAALPAVLTGSALEPFALRSGMEIAIAVDGRLASTIRFRPDDFASIAAATAGEVAAVLNANLTDITADSVAGALRLTSHIAGADSSIRIEQYATSVVSIESSARGRLATFEDNTAGTAQRRRLFYEASDPVFSAELESSPAASGAAVPGRVRGQVRYKTFRGGEWGASLPLTALPEVAESDPAVLQLPSGAIFAAWIEDPDTPTSRILFTTGAASVPEPAVILGNRGGPFVIRPGSNLLLHGNWPRPDGVEFAASDFANPDAALASEVAAVINARAQRVQAAVVNNAVAITTAAAGGGERLIVEIGGSSAAGSLGFDASNAEASGVWGDEISWAPPSAGPAGPGRIADLFAILDAAGNVQLFWAGHTGTTWNLFTSTWNGAAWSANSLLSSAGGGNREPSAALDASNRIWLIWSQRTGIGTAEDTWTLRRRVFDPVTLTWDGEAAVTSALLPRSADRESAPIRLASGDLQVFFQSDRSGGAGLWSVTITPATAVTTAPAMEVAGAAFMTSPAPYITGNLMTLLHRSDRHLPQSRLGSTPPPRGSSRVTSPPPAPPGPGPVLSFRSVDSGSIKRSAGLTTVTLGHNARNGRRRLFDDMLGYTVQRPLGGSAEPPLSETDFYTRGTIGLYLSQVVPESTLALDRIARLREVLRRFLPVNVRAIVILAPRVDIEFVYAEGAGIGETVLDEHPDIEYFGAIGETAAAAAPGWTVLISNQLASTSVDPANTTTLRRRTYFPPLS